MSAAPIALSIAGFDCSAGAGIQADLKTFTALGVHGLTATTCIVAETPLEVRSIEAVSASSVRDQIDILLDSYPVSALKLGMLYDRPQMEAVHSALEKSHIARVIDPVMLASSGGSLLKDAAMEYFQNSILPLATILTPNLAEAEYLLNRKIRSESEAQDGATTLAKRFDCICVLKGGHFEKSQEAVDWVSDGAKVESLAAERLPISSQTETHGTGCTFSAAITAELAKGHDPKKAVTAAKHFVTEAIRHRYTWKNLSALKQSL